MEWLNYHHLLYFWLVAREGSIRGACRQLLISQPAVSTQIRALESSLGEKLFSRAGRSLVLTEAGRLVYRYADEIFPLGQEIRDALAGRAPHRSIKLVVGVTDVLSKLIAYRLLEPALRLPEPVQVICREGKTEQLLAELALHRLDLALSDTPVTPSVRVRAFNHLLGECGLSIFAAPKLAAKYRHGFPRSLAGAPLLVPTQNTSVRQALDQWFHGEDIQPAIVGEFEDSALLKVFGENGHGLFPAPSVIEREVAREYRVRPVGRIEAARTRFYAISVERKLKHPAVKAICEAAREGLFSITSPPAR